MGPLTIQDAKDIAYEIRARAVIVIAFGDEQVAATSYGHNRKACNAAAGVLDELHGLLTSGAVSVPDELR